MSEKENQMMRRHLVIGLTIALAVSAVETYATQHDQKPDAPAMPEGEVCKVDQNAKKITLRHGPMPHLDMPAHTMVFQVKDPAMLELVKPGEKVRFQAEKVGGAFMITKIEPAK